jgi:Zn-dependent protease
MSTFDDEARKRAENLRAVIAGLHEPADPPKPAASSTTPDGTKPAHHRGRNSVLGSIGAGLAFLLGKLKFLSLLAGVLKLKTFATMILSIALYANQWGWPFAIGFVLLIFVHESGHAAVMQREGIPASAPVFIPFLGAVIAMRGRPRDAYVEAKVAIGGPVAGSLAAWATLLGGLVFHQPLLVSLGHAGILLNLFNLIPVSPLDGGRIAGAFTHQFWIAGYALGLVALLLTRSPILLIVMVVGLITLWQRWKHPIPGYHDIPRAQRLAIGLGYAALVISLALTLPIGLTTHPSLGG